MERIIYFYRRKQGVTAEQSRRWTLEVDIPITSTQPGMQKFQVGGQLLGRGASRIPRPGEDRSRQLRGLDKGGRAAGYEEGCGRVAFLLRPDLNPGNTVDEDRVAQELPGVLGSLPDLMRSVPPPPQLAPFEKETSVEGTATGCAGSFTRKLWVRRSGGAPGRRPSQRLGRIRLRPGGQSYVRQMKFQLPTLKRRVSGTGRLWCKCCWDLSKGSGETP